MFIGIDFGGTNIAAGLVTADGELVAQGSTPTLSGRPIAEVVDDMAGLCKKLVDDYGIKLSDIEGVGIGSPGSIDFKTGTVIY